MEFLVFLIFGFVFVCIFIRQINDIKSTEQENRFSTLKNNLSSIATYTSSGSKLSITERSFKFNNAITFEKHKHYDVKYEPEKYVYTGATVGGVTTGGIHKAGDYHYISNAENTGRYYFDYCGNPVNKIELTNALLEQAKKSNISKYIKDNFIVVYDDDAVEMPDHVAKALLTGSTDAMNLATRYTAMGYPTYSKCVEIKNWICGTN